jgi:hypothetical protein
MVIEEPEPVVVGLEKCPCLCYTLCIPVLWLDVVDIFRCDLFNVMRDGFAFGDYLYFVFRLVEQERILSRWTHGLRLAGKGKKEYIIVGG